MAVTKAFTNDVASGNIKGVRIIMKDSLLVDLTFRDFEEMSRIAGNMPGLYDAHDGRELIMDKTLWNDAYMNKLMVQVVGNFSHERLNHLKEVVRYLYPAPEPSVRTQPRSERHEDEKPARPVDYRVQKAADERDGRIVKIVGGSAAGAIIGGAGAAVLGATTGAAVACAAAGAIAGGVIVSATTKGV